MATEKRGQARIDELQANFPGVPRSAIIKADAFREGISWTPDLNVIGRWALPHTHMIFDWDHDHLDDKMEVEEGWVMIPCLFQLADSTTTILKLATDSPYEIRTLEGNARYRLYRDREPIEDVFFEARPRWFTKRTSDGSLMCKVVSTAGSNCIFAITLLSYCQYFKTNEQCVFCCIVPSVEHAKELGIDRVLKPTFQRVLEVYQAASSEQPIGHFNLTGGGLLDRKREADLYVEFLNQMMAEVGDTGLYWHVITQALDEDDQKRLCEAGRGKITVCHPLEAWDEKLYPVIAPGKARHVGRDEWIRSVLRLPKFLGDYRSTTTIVAGCELSCPDGPPSVRAAVKSMEEYLKFFLDHGVLPRFTFWTPAPGSPWENAPPPPTEYFLEISQLEHEMFHQYGAPLLPSTCHKCRAVSLESDIERLTKEDDDGEAAYGRNEAAH